MRRSVLSVLPLVLVFGVVAGGGPARSAGAQDTTPGGSPTAACPATTDDENEAIARRWHEEAINEQRLDVLDEILGPEVVHHSATFPDAVGPDAAERILAALLAGFPDVQHTVEQVIAEGNSVATRWTAEGTHLGDFQGIAPTGRRVTWTGINIFRLECGRIVEVWSELDGIGRLQQLGVLPAAAADAGATGDIAASPVGRAADCPTTSEAENETLVRRWWDEAWTQGNVDALDEVLAENHVHHWAVGPDTTGREPVKERIASWRRVLPDLRFDIEHILQEGNLVVGRWTGRGSHGGEFQGVAPTGQPVEFTGINVFRIECGRIAEIWSEMDTVGFHQQLGVMPTAGTPVP